MKNPLIILLVLVSFSQSNLMAQSLAIKANVSLSLYQLKTDIYSVSQVGKHCNAIRVGEVLMITGGAVMAAGAIGFATINPGPNGDLGTGGILAFAVVAMGGIVTAGGIIVFAMGEIHDHTHRQRVTIIGKKNEVGLAYNF